MKASAPTEDEGVSRFAPPWRLRSKRAEWPKNVAGREDLVGSEAIGQEVGVVEERAFPRFDGGICQSFRHPGPVDGLYGYALARSRTAFHSTAGD